MNKTDPQAPASRQATLDRYGLLGLLPKATLERFAQLIGYTLRVDSASIHFVAEDHEYTVASTSSQAAGSGSLPLAESFAAHVVHEGQVVVSADTRRDPRFRHIGRVRSHEILFYAGAPLTTPDGLHIGALSIMDTQPRLLNSYEEQLLGDYARLVVSELENWAARDPLRESALPLPSWRGPAGSWPTELVHPSASTRLAAQRPANLKEPLPPARRRTSRNIRKKRVFSLRQEKTPGPRVTGTLASDPQERSHEPLVENLWRLAYYDPLTGLPNRVLFNDRLTLAFDTARAQGTLVVVGVIDLDGFKRVNDTYGHAVGDDLLVFVANRLTGVLRSDCTLARLSGDEFALLVTGVQQEGHLKTIALRLVQALREPFCVAGHELLVQGSLGVVVFPLDVVDNQTALVRADLAMYQAKRQKLGWSRYADREPETEQLSRS